MNRRHVLRAAGALGLGTAAASLLGCGDTNGGSSRGGRDVVLGFIALRVKGLYLALVTLAGIGGPLVLYALIEWTGWGRFLFERPAWARIDGPAPGAALREVLGRRRNFGDAGLDRSLDAPAGECYRLKLTDTAAAPHARARRKDAFQCRPVP
jgi:hypothetical protein